VRIACEIFDGALPKKIRFGDQKPNHHEAKTAAPPLLAMLTGLLACGLSMVQGVSRRKCSLSLRWPRVVVAEEVSRVSRRVLKMSNKIPLGIGYGYGVGRGYLNCQLVCFLFIPIDLEPSVELEALVGLEASVGSEALAESEALAASEALVELEEALAELGVSAELAGLAASGGLEASGDSAMALATGDLAMEALAMEELDTEELAMEEWDMESAMELVATQHLANTNT